MTDPRRYDIPTTKSVTPGEVWDFTVTVQEEQEDGTYDPASSFSSYDAWAFYIFESLATAGGTATARAAKAYVSLSAGSGITVGSAPTVTIQATAAQTANVPPGATRAYELWATVNGSAKRLAYGTIPVVH